MAAEKNSANAPKRQPVPIHKQAYLGLAIASFTVFSVVTGLVKPYPDTWSWESSADFFNSAHSIWTIAAIIYYPVIFGIKYAMKDKEPFDLGGASSKRLINWIFWWETGLATFSIVGAYYVVPNTLKPLLDGKGWVQAVCGRGDALDDPTSGYWTFLFCISKLFEFGDTIFVVLRKKKLILLQHYHHLATMVFCWGCCVLVKVSHGSNILYFTAMNLSVHSVMYTWYAATRTGWRSPKIMMMMVTIIQLVQMVAGVSFILTSILNGCPDPLSYPGLVMYFSYLVLFARLFHSNYCTKKTKRSKDSKDK